MEALWIVLAGALIASINGLLGTFLILRKTVMVSDAISHSLLPGIVGAVMISGEIYSSLTFISAAAFGVFCVLLIETLINRIKLQSDAAIGFAYTVLFSVGVIMLSAFGRNLDVDEECVLFGEIAFVPLEAGWLVGDVIVPDTVLWLVGLLVVVIAFLSVGYKGLLISTFNADYAHSIGLRTFGWNIAFMFIVSLSTVVSFESVGSILVVAFFVLPPATAYLLSTRLRTMFIITTVVGVLSSVCGYYMAVVINSSIAPAMCTTAALIFFVTLFYKKTIAAKRRTSVAAMQAPA